MAQALRIQFAGAIYHVTAGHERRAIFRDDADSERDLELLAEQAKTAHVRVNAHLITNQGLTPICR